MGHALRLTLTPAPGRAGRDGVWRPHSRDLASEGAQLVDEFPPERGQVERMVFFPADWDVTGKCVLSRRGRIKIASFPHDDTHQIMLRLTGGPVLHLEVDHDAR